MVEVGMGVGAVKDAIRGVVDAQVEPRVLARLAQRGARALDGIVRDFPVHEQAIRIHGHAGHAVIVVGPGNGSGRLVLGVLAHFEFVRPGRIRPIASGRGRLLDHCGQVALGGRLPCRLLGRGLLRHGSAASGEITGDASGKLVLAELGDAL